MSKFKVGEAVRHDFSRNTGHIRIIDNNRKPYIYFVMWDEDVERSDWYKPEVLEGVSDLPTKGSDATKGSSKAQSTASPTEGGDIRE